MRDKLLDFLWWLVELTDNSPEMSAEAFAHFDEEVWYKTIRGRLFKVAFGMYQFAGTRLL